MSLQREARLSPRCLLDTSSVSASSRGHSPFGGHSRQSSLISSSSANSSFQQQQPPPPPYPRSKSTRHLRQCSELADGGGGAITRTLPPERHYRQSSEPLLTDVPPRTSESFGGARRKVLPPPPLARVSPRPPPVPAPTVSPDFLLGASKMSSPTYSIDQGYHTMLNHGESWETSMDSINLTCPPVTARDYFSVDMDILITQRFFRML